MKPMSLSQTPSTSDPLFFLLLTLSNLKPCPHLLLQIIVLDSVTLEEVGVSYAIKFSVQRVDYRRSMMYRIAKLQAAIQAQMDAGAGDPFDLPEV